MNGFDVKKYVDEVNRLGLDAVEKRGTPDFKPATEKLKLYFIKNYILYLHDIKRLEIDFKTFDSGKSKIAANLNEKKQSYIDREFDYAYSKFKGNFFENKVNNFDPEKAGNSTAPFFAFLIRDFTIGAKNRTAKEEKKNQTNWMVNYLSDRDARLIKKMRDLYDSMDKSGNFFTETSIKFGISEKKAKELWSKNQDYFFSLNKKFSDDDGNSVETADTVEDIVERVEDVYEAKYGFAEELLLWNKIYRESFMPKHKAAFPPYFTNEMIVCWVDDVKDKNENRENTIRDKWDVIDVATRRRMYPETKYLCIRESIYDQFEDIRRIITGKEIAASIGMSPSNFTKACNQAKELIQNYKER